MMNRPAKLALAAVCLFAAGCTPYVDPEAARREQERLDSQTCTGYGTVIGSPAYNDCMRDLAANRGYSGYYYDDRYDTRYDEPYTPPYRHRYPGDYRYNRY